MYCEGPRPHAQLVRGHVMGSIGRDGLGPGERMFEPLAAGVLEA